MGFIRFSNKNYILETQTTCLLEEGQEAIFGDGLDFLIDDEGNSLISSVDAYKPCNTDEGYEIPAKQGDTLKFIIDKSEIDHKGADATNLRIGLANCGVLIVDNVGSIIESDNQYFITANIPTNVSDCTYNFVIYNVINPVDCSQFAGLTLAQTQATGTVLGQVLECTLNDFL